MAEKAASAAPAPAGASAAAGSSGSSAAAVGTNAEPAAAPSHPLQPLPPDAICRCNQDGRSDGSTEAAYNAAMPFDASPVTGADLTEFEGQRRLRSSFGFGGGRGGGGGLRELLRMAMPPPELMPEGKPKTPEEALAAIMGLGGGAAGGRGDSGAAGGSGKIGAVRPAPHPRSSPLASFRNSAAVPFRSPAPHASPATSTSGGAASSRGTGGAAALDDACRIATAQCEVDIRDLIPSCYGVFHIDGDVLGVGYSQGWKQRDPGLGVLAFDNLQQAEERRRRQLQRQQQQQQQDADEDGGDDEDDTNYDPMARCWCDEEEEEEQEGEEGEEAPAARAQNPAEKAAAGQAGLGGKEQPAAAATRAGAEPRFRGSLGFRDCDDLDELEGTVGRAPDAAYLLPKPIDSAAETLTGLRHGQRRTPGMAARAEMVTRTLLLGASSPTAGSTSGAAAAHWGAGGTTLVAALDGTGGVGGGLGGNMIVAWDLETKRVRNRFFGHLNDITDLAAPPPSWQQQQPTQQLFASCARSGDAKVWDLRMHGGAAAVTLTAGGTMPLSAVCLAASEGGGDGAGGGAGALGAGLLGFAGGANESIWCWDLRGGAARPLYELSTGNCHVQALAWHGRSCSLLAAVQSVTEDRHGEQDKADWVRVAVDKADEEGVSDDEEGLFEDARAAHHAGGEFVVRRWWPRGALHRPQDFPRYWVLAESCVLRYRFSAGANTTHVPPSQVPCFSSALEDTEVEEVLVGWRGETYNAGAHTSSTTVPADGAAAAAAPWIETVSWVPRAFVYHGFLSPQECDHLIGLALPKLERSLVVGDSSDEVDPIRTSFSASIGFNETDVVAEIEDRIARWTHLPRDHQEPMEVLRYINGQKYDAHWDWFEDKSDAGGTPGGNRMATVLMYLSDVEPNAGGETALPLAQPLDWQVQAVQGRGYSECAAKMGISVRPKKGDVLLFWDMDPGGQQPDRHALHASCPTVAGTKWTATKWIHNTPYG
ncbi:hypothetical protein HXX76_009858 [Chlamydomonas incerta]|uniref:Fe2OG dioxygenase domain-containing protein n=1 Tax=Chlamydomonas incerta TaxID=51695 RepID=A0A835VWW9_CHLIN|nr:hypothetical protein HXX76_009858 [Chlamydomonas incerta]|eukprot:KAG2430885.1 hypothetical protein HXX76_009858 [Chlamydomonas incerta]